MSDQQPVVYRTCGKDASVPMCASCWARAFKADCEKLKPTPSVPPGKEASMTLEVLESTAEPGVWRVEQIDVKSGDCYVTNFYGPDSEQRARRYFAMLSVPPGGEDDPLQLVINSLGDLASVGRFSPAVDPSRWARDLQTALAKTHEQHAAQLAASDATVTDLQQMCNALRAELARVQAAIQRVKARYLENWPIDEYLHLTDLGEAIAALIAQEESPMTPRERTLAEALQALITAVTYKTPTVEFSPGNPCWDARVPVAFVDDARAALATPLASPSVCEWRDISTAPKDGTRIDVVAKAWLPAFDRFELRRFPDVYWYKGDSLCNSGARWMGVDRDWRPVGWMPIPPLSLPTPEVQQ